MAGDVGSCFLFRAHARHIGSGRPPFPFCRVPYFVTRLPFSPYSRIHVVRNVPAESSTAGLKSPQTDKIAVRLHADTDPKPGAFRTGKGHND